MMESSTVIPFPSERCRPPYESNGTKAPVIQLPVHEENDYEDEFQAACDPEMITKAFVASIEPILGENPVTEESAWEDYDTFAYFERIARLEGIHSAIQRTQKRLFIAAIMGCSFEHVP